MEPCPLQDILKFALRFCWLFFSLSTVLVMNPVTHGSPTPLPEGACVNCVCKKGQAHSRTINEDPESERRCTCTLSLTWALDGGRWSTPLLGRLTPRERDPVPILQKAGLVPGPVWKGAEYLVATGFRSRDRAVRSDSLYRLSLY